MSRILQIVRLPVPPGYQIPSDLQLTEALDADALDSIDPCVVEVIVTHSVAGMPPELWDRFPALQLIANLGVGIDRIDLEEARKRGVSVTFTPNQLTADVADLAIGFAIALLRRIGSADRFVRDRHWSSGPFPLATSLAGKKFGILGLGRIGAAVAERAGALGMEVAYCGRKPNPASTLPFVATALELAAWADILVATLPGGPETDGLISSEVLRALGPGGYLINVARASVVDEAALVAALRIGGIAGAALELFAPQSPLIDALKDFDNVILTPHIGSATLETRTAMANSVFGNVRAALAGEPLVDLAT